MDAIVVIVIVGCAIVGLWWGALRMATLVAAVVAATLAARWVAPGAADLLLGGPAEHGHITALVTAGVALGAALLVWIAGVGLRRGMSALHLSWLDRLVGFALGGGAAAVVLAVALALAARSGHVPASPIAQWLAEAGRTAVAVQSFSASRSTPTNTPSTATRSGQQPR
jgi:uncharacterized membrane protein required for colicin V production